MCLSLLGWCYLAGCILLDASNHSVSAFGTRHLFNGLDMLCSLSFAFFASFVADSADWAFSKDRVGIDKLCASRSIVVVGAV